MSDSECRFERAHDKIVAGVHARRGTGEAPDIEGIPAANFELERWVFVEAELQSNTPLCVVIATLAERAPLVSEIARKLRRDVSNLAERPGVAELDHVVVASLAEIVWRPVIVEFDFELVVEQAARNAAPEVEMSKLPFPNTAPQLG